MKSWAMAGLLLATVSSTSPAQTKGDASSDYPNKPVRIVVGFTPGGGPDITARYIAQKLTEAWKRQVIVENRPGAGGTIAAGMVARANPDGYTLLSVTSAHAIAPAIYAKLPYDTLKELSGITQTGSSKYVLVVAPSLGIKSLKELLAAAKAKPGQIAVHARPGGRDAPGARVRGLALSSGGKRRNAREPTMPTEEMRTKVTIFTGSYRIKGYIDLIPGARVTDYMAEAKLFIAVTDAEVWELEVAGRHLISAPFLNVSREHIQIVVPGQ